MAPLLQGRVLLRAATLAAAAGAAGGASAPAKGAGADAVDLCGHSPELCGINSFSGFVPVQGVGSLFYWYFQPTEVVAEAPLMLWLQGGPGASSMTGNFFELGPVSLDGTGALKRRNVAESWASKIPMLFVDSPVGTGWSFADRKDTCDSYARTSQDVAANLAEFLQRFKELHPEVPDSLVIAGESYGGHYVPALGAHLLEHPGPLAVQAISIGDGWTDPPEQVMTKPMQAYAFGLVDEKQRDLAQTFAKQAHSQALAGNFTAAKTARDAMEGIIRDASQINFYDVRTTQSYDWMETRMNLFFGQAQVKELLHVPTNMTFGTNSKVEECLLEDNMHSQKDSVEKLLEAGVRVLLYQGQFDLKDGVVSNEAWIQTLAWRGTASFLKAARAIWRRSEDMQIAGYWRKYLNLEQVVVLGGGHMSPMDQPLSATDMIGRFLGLLPHVVVAAQEDVEAVDAVQARTTRSVAGSDPPVVIV